MFLEPQTERLETFNLTELLNFHKTQNILFLTKQQLYMLSLLLWFYKLLGDILSFGAKCGVLRLTSGGDLAVTDPSFSSSGAKLR